MLRPPPEMAMNSDAADVGYGGTLGYDKKGGWQGSWEGQGFCLVSNRAKPVSLRKLRAIHLLLQRQFSEYVSNPRVRRLLAYEDI